MFTVCVRVQNQISVILFLHLIEKRVNTIFRKKQKKIENEWEIFHSNSYDAHIKNSHRAYCVVSSPNKGYN